MRSFLIIIFILVGANLGLSLLLFSEIKVAPSIQVIKEHTITQLSPEEAAPKPKEIEPIKTDISATKEESKNEENKNDEVPKEKDWSNCSTTPPKDISSLLELELGDFVTDSSDESAAKEAIEVAEQCRVACKSKNACALSARIDTQYNCWCGITVDYVNGKNILLGSLLENIVEQERTDEDVGIVK